MSKVTDLFEVNWNCPRCRQVNRDDYAEVSKPICSNCGDKSEWEEVICSEKLCDLNNLLQLKKRL